MDTRINAFVSLCNQLIQTETRESAHIIEPIKAWQCLVLAALNEKVLVTLEHTITLMNAFIGANQDALSNLNAQSLPVQPVCYNEQIRFDPRKLLELYANDFDRTFAVWSGMISLCIAFDKSTVWPQVRYRLDMLQKTEHEKIKAAGDPNDARSTKEYRMLRELVDEWKQTTSQAHASDAHPSTIIQNVLPIAMSQLTAKMQTSGDFNPGNLLKAVIAFTTEFGNNDNMHPQLRQSLQLLQGVSTVAQQAFDMHSSAPSPAPSVD